MLNTDKELNRMARVSFSIVAHLYTDDFYVKTVYYPDKTESKFTIVNL